MMTSLFKKVLKGLAVVPVLLTSSFAAWNGSAVEPLDFNVVEGKKFYIISTPEHLAWVGSQVRNGYSGINVVLANDIVFGDDTSTVSARNWTPIGKDSLDMFAGTFDGAGHTIYGLRSEQGAYAGLIGLMDDAGIVKNLRMAASEIIATDTLGRAGGFVARNWGTIDSCVNEGTVKLTNKAYYGGGFVGSNGGTIKNSVNKGYVESSIQNVRSYIGGVAGFNAGMIELCENIGEVTATATKAEMHVSAAGIAGGLGDEGKIFSCINRGTIIAQNTSNASTSDAYTTRAGGIVAGADAQTEIAFCKNFGTVSALSKVASSNSSSSSRATHAGGIVANISGTVRNSVNHGAVYSENSYSGTMSQNQVVSAGGIVSYGLNANRISDCTNEASVTGKSYYSRFWIYVGGIVGQNNNIVERSANFGDVSANILSSSTTAGSNAYIHIGGVVGGNKEIVRDCYNLGKVTATKVATNSFVGGVAGSQFYTGTKLLNSFSAAASVIGTDAGGIVGYNADTSFVQYCYFDAGVLPNKPSIGTTKTNATAKDTVAMKSVDMKNDNFAWILNTANGNGENRGVWSRMTGYPVIASDSAKAIYRVTMDNDGELSTRYAKSELSFKSYPQGADGYTFVAWLNEDGTPFVSGSAVAKDMTLTALYSTAETPVYLVTFFDDNGKVLDATLTNSENKVAAFPVVPEENEKGLFAGWFDKLKNLFSEESVFSANTELTATYELQASSSSVIPSEGEGSSSSAKSSSSVKDESSSSSVASSSSSAKSSSSGDKTSSSSAKSSSSSNKSSSSSAKSSSSSNKSSSSSAKSSSSSGKSSSSSAKSSSSSSDKTGFGAITIAGFSVETGHRSISIVGAAVGAKVHVMDMQGRVMYSARAEKANFTISLNRNGSYIVRVGNQSRLVNIK